jgi:hypothetical protein
VRDKVDLISAAMAAYNGPVPEVFEEGVRSGIIMSIEFLKLCAGISDIEVSRKSKESQETK